MDVDFSLLEIPEATQLNFDSSKHKRSLSKKGSFAHRKSPTRATIRPRSQTVSFLDSTDHESTSDQIDTEDVPTGEPDTDSHLENSSQGTPGAGKTVPGLVEVLRSAQILYSENRTIPKARITASPASSPSIPPVSSPTTTSVSTLDTSPTDSQNLDLVLPKTVPGTSHKPGDDEGINTSLSTCRTRHSQGSKFVEDSEARSQIPSSKVMVQSSSLKDGVDLAGVTDPTTLPAPALTLMPHVDYSNDKPGNETLQSVELQPRLRDPDLLSGTEIRHSRVMKKPYPTKFIINSKSTPRNPDSTNDNPKSTPQNPDSTNDNRNSTNDNSKYTPESSTKTPAAFNCTEYTRQNTNRERISIGRVSIAPTAVPELKYCTVDNTNITSNSSSKTGSKYWSNTIFDVSGASGKNSAGLNSKMATVDISNRTDQKRVVDLRADNQKSLSFGEIRVIPEYDGGNYRQKDENKREESGNVLNITGFSKSERVVPKQFVDSSSSVEVPRQNPRVTSTIGEVTIVCSLDNSLRGIKSAVVANDNGTESVGSFTESCLTAGSLQSTGVQPGVAIAYLASDHTPVVTSASFLTPSPGSALRGDEVTQLEEGSNKVEVYTSSFCMQLRGGYRPGGKELGRVGVDAHALPERTFRFSFTPKTDSNTSLNIANETAGGQS